MLPGRISTAFDVREEPSSLALSVWRKTLQLSLPSSNTLKSHCLFKSNTFKSDSLFKSVESNASTSDLFSIALNLKPFSQRLYNSPESKSLKVPVFSIAPNQRPLKVIIYSIAPSQMPLKSRCLFNRTKSNAFKSNCLTNSTKSYCLFNGTESKTF
jgi:hypothetical protein